MTAPVASVRRPSAVSDLAVAEINAIVERALASSRPMPGSDR